MRFLKRWASSPKEQSSVVTKASGAEAKTEAIYLKTEAQGSWPIIINSAVFP